MTRRRHALVAGAGIGGLCAALSLARAGWRVSLFEQADRLKEVGAGLQLSPNASILLQRLGVLDALRPACLAPASVEILAADGATLASVPLGDAAERWGAPYLLAHRADLQRALVEAASRESAIELCAGTEIAGFTSGAEAVSVAIRQGAGSCEISGDCLIGADGSRSTIRLQMHAGRADARKSTTRTAWRALVDPAKAPAVMRGDRAFLWLGRKAHLVHYPLRKGSVINVVAIVESGAGDAGALSGWSNPGEAARLEARFSGWHSSARALLAAAPGWRVWPLFDRDPIADWTAGRVALLGDAAHPMLPFLAQGAAQAIEDAAALGEALAPDREVARSLIVYQNARQARAARVQKASRRQGEIYHLSGVAAAARNLAFTALGGSGLRARQDWLYDARR